MFIGDSPQERCISIGIVNDDILEDPESFLVLIESNVTRGVSVTPNSTVVLIVGSEGEEIVAASASETSLLASFLTDVIVGLQAVRYSVEEGNSVMVCAELVGEIEIAVEVTLSSETSGLAEGINITTYTSYTSYWYYLLHFSAGRDYSTLSVVLTFEREDVEQCVNISTMADNVVEEEETFSVLLSSPSPQNVTLMPNRAPVAIMDRTGNGYVEIQLSVIL